MRKGFTAAELTVVIVVVGILCALAIPAVMRRMDRTHVRAATAELLGIFSAARTHATTSGRYVAVSVDSTRSSVTVSMSADTLFTRAIGAVHGVYITSNRDSMAYTPAGLGHGAANQTIVVRRGGLEDTVVVSRLGRVR